MSSVDTLWGCRGLANVDVLAVTESHMESVISHPIPSKSAGDQVCSRIQDLTVFALSSCVPGLWKKAEPGHSSGHSLLTSDPQPPHPLFRITNMCYSFLGELI